MDRSQRSAAAVVLVTLALVSGRAAPSGAAAVLPAPLTLEAIMAHPDWIGRAPEGPYWSDDGRWIYYRQKREGEDARDLVRVPRDGGSPEVVPDADLDDVDRPGVESHDHLHKVYVRRGDLYLKDLKTGAVRQLTRSRSAVTAPRFLLGDRRIEFRRDGDLFLRDLDSGLEMQVADLRLDDDPDSKDDDDGFLARQQERLFEIIRRREARRDASRDRDRELHDADDRRLPPPYYLGRGNELLGRVLAPQGDRLVVRVAKELPDRGKRDTMPEFVTAEGYVTTRTVRPKVAATKLRGERLVLVDLVAREMHDLDLSVLPDIAADPLEELEQERKQRDAARKGDGSGDEADAAAQDDDAPEDETPAAETGDDPAGAGAGAGADDEATAEERGENEGGPPRAVTVRSLAFSEDGRHAVFQAFSLDHKDRWIARLDPDSRAVVPVDRFHDPAWVNRRLARLGWLPGGATIYYTAEKDGYAHLFVHDVDEGTTRQLTTGRYEVSSVRPSRDGRHLYFRANPEHPGIYETYRVAVATGAIEQLTRLGGTNRSILSPDERHLLVIHSTTTRPPELYVQPNTPGADARRLTETVSPAFEAVRWIAPRHVEIPSRHGPAIHARLYLPRGPAPDAPRPAVLFVHGAGYLQNAHQGWSGYFREFMFHTLLAERGYVVLDMDYRASAGYGREWRTAIHRRMGTPEVEDLADGVAWLADEHGVDARRVGVYGGSYGGFLTLMALFREPDLFACGAALRPVTDWAHYSHGYTSRILHEPELDPAAYEASSPIEFADGLEKPLLICHGMLDDNVLFLDTVRLAQRLIELRKEHWEVAIYPVEAHGFREPESWLDEYRRILALFERHLRPAPAAGPDVTPGARTRPRRAFPPSP